jgi:anti-sigma-K factor RskA
VPLVGTDRAPDASGEVVQPVSGGPPLLVVRGLPRLSQDQVYEVWVIAGGQPTSAGLLQPSDEQSSDEQSTMVRLRHEITGAEIVALTAEPAGGSPGPGPTGPVYIAGRV